MSLGPDRDPITRPMFVWLEVASRLNATGDGGLADEIARRMDRRRLGDNVLIALTLDEQRRVDAVLQDWLGRQDPE